MGRGGLGAKFLVVFGELSLVGAPLGGPAWSRLVGPAVPSGADTIAVPKEWATSIGLRKGDRLVVGPSSLTWDESEIVTVRGCCNATLSVVDGVEVESDDSVDVVLDTSLLYDHTASDVAKQGLKPWTCVPLHHVLLTPAETPAD